MPIKKPIVEILLKYAWNTSVVLPAACALLVFPLMPNYFEYTSIKADRLLDIIELGRSRPWVVFTGLPYPAALRLFGDISGVFAILNLFVLSLILLRIALAKNGRGQIVLRKYKIQIVNSKTLEWPGKCILFLFIAFAGLFVFIEHFIESDSIKVIWSGRLALHVFLASSSPCCIISAILMAGFIVYCKLSNIN